MPLQMCDVRHIESLPLKMKYREQAALVERRLRAMPAPKYLALDQTGVGNAAIEFYHHMSPIGIKIHGGDGVTRVSDQQYHVPKRDLVMCVQILLQSGVLRFPTEEKLPGSAMLAKEMQNFKYKISAKGHDTYEAWRESAHDDLVLALACACWTAQTIISAQALRLLRPPDDFTGWSISPY